MKAKKYREGQSRPGDKRRHIADAIEHVVQDMYPSLPPYMLCGPRAALTRDVLGRIYPERTWVVAVGSMFACIADNDDLMSGWDVEAGIAEGRGGADFLAWLAGADLSEPVGGEVHMWTVGLGTTGSDTIVDTSTRHLPAYTTVMGATWTRAVLPFAWDNPASLRDKRYFYKPYTRGSAALHPRIDDAAMQVVGLLAQLEADGGTRG